MTKFRSRPVLGYQAFLVRPSRDFAPKNWRDWPSDYRVLEQVGIKALRGEADAWRFLHNHQALRSQDFRVWAIFVELRHVQTGTKDRLPRTTKKDSATARRTESVFTQLV